MIAYVNAGYLNSEGHFKTDVVTVAVQCSSFGSCAKPEVHPRPTESKSHYLTMNDTDSSSVDNH